MRNWFNREAARPSRLLAIEVLESRDLLAVIRLADWNTANRPNDLIDEGNYQTILAAIGEETVQGNTKRIDILAIQETDPAAGGNSIGRIETVFDTLYPVTNYNSFVSTVDGGGDSTGFIYDTSTVSLLETFEVTPASLTHRVLRGKFRPEATFGESDFFVYTVHLKSGATASDASIRGAEAATIRSNADGLGEGALVLIVGDFNMKTSTELAYSNLTTSGAGQVQDVADAPGNWFNNSAFKSLHSQDPGLNMDDRFDIHFASGEFDDGAGLEYVDGSFHVFGNNGTHTFGQPITTGTGASPAILAALAAASDHLPVVADYEFIISAPGVRITQTSGGTKVAEGGFFDTYSIVLDTVPAANVSVTVTPNGQLDIGSGAGVARVLTFTPGNALTPQTIVVNAVNDLALEGTHSGLITHTSASSDATYNGLSIVNITVTILDNDGPTIVINEIDSDNPSTDTFEFVELYDGGVGNTSLAGKTLVFFNGSNDTAYAIFDLTGYSTDASGFFVLGNAGVANVDLVMANGSLQNGADAVALYSGAFAMSGAVTTANLLDAVVYDTGDADDAGLLALLLPGQPQVNENQNSSGTTDSLSRVPDYGTPRQTSSYVAKAPTPGTANQSAAPGVIITQSGSRVDVAEGGMSDSYQLALLTIPTANVQITVDPDGQTNLGAGAGVAIVLTFTPANALIPQTVNVTAVDDAAVEGDHSSLITHTAASSDSGYNGLSIGDVVANVADNDATTTTTIVISEIMYNPASDETAPGVGEWIEIVNTGVSSVDISGWLFDDEDAAGWGAIPAATILNPGQIGVFFDAAFTTAADFRAAWSVPVGSLVIGVSWGGLANTPSATNEVLVLLNNVGLQMDIANFDDAAPWPAGTVDGPSIYLKGVTLDNNAGGNWLRSSLGTNGAIAPSGPIFSTGDIGSPGRFFLPGDYNSNGIVDAADYTIWRDTLGSTIDLRADGSGPSAGVPNGVVDQFDYAFWAASFGQTGIPGGGNGSGSGNGSEGNTSGAGEGSAVTASAASIFEPVEENATAADTVFLNFSPSFSIEKASRSTSLAGSSSQASFASSDQLLLLIQNNNAAGSDSLLEEEAYKGELDEVDAFFATLGEWELAVEL